MKFTLEQYQSDAVDSVLTNLAKARAGYLDDGERTAVGLTAPTGAGKTVIATAVLVGIYKGTATRPPNPSTTVLWITDDRALNAQTISKITQAAGGSIDINRIRLIGEIDHRTLEPGVIYFVHIQAMQKNSTLHAVRPDGAKNDKRTHGVWDMIANTVRDRGEDFLVIWDEAPGVRAPKTPTASRLPGPSSTAAPPTSAHCSLRRRSSWVFRLLPTDSLPR